MQDITRQDKPRQIKPSALPSQHFLLESKTDYTSAHSPLFLFKFFTNTHIPVFHPQKPLPALFVLCVQRCDSVHTRNEPISISSSGCGNLKREETKHGEVKPRDSSASVLNGDSYHVFHSHQPSRLPTQHPPAFPPLPPRRHETRRKSSRCREIFVKLKQQECSE
jgi:hypothetical protein